MCVVGPKIIIAGGSRGIHEPPSNQPAYVEISWWEVGEPELMHRSSLRIRSCRLLMLPRTRTWELTFAPGLAVRIFECYVVGRPSDRQRRGMANGFWDIRMEDLHQNQQSWVRCSDFTAPPWTDTCVVHFNMKLWSVCILARMVVWCNTLLFRVPSGSIKSFQERYPTILQGEGIDKKIGMIMV